MYTLIVKFQAQDIQTMCHDYSLIEQAAASLGAFSTTIYKDLNQKYFIQIQSWPSKTLYDAVFSLKEWDFPAPAKEKMDPEMFAVVQKLRSVYKMEILHELESILG